ncbi:hypothetical protein C8J56DRAFT_748860, partial [Mycena floridula]
VQVSESEVSCWIASEANQNFSIGWQNAMRYDNIESMLFIDGVNCSRRIILDWNHFPSTPSESWISSFRTSLNNCRNFVFSEIEVTDDDSHMDCLPEGFGSIRLDLWRYYVLNIEQQPVTIFSQRYSTPSLNAVVHEGAKMDGRHCVQFGRKYTTTRIETADTVDGFRMDHKPLVTFIFRYKPLALLVADDIVP